MTTTNETPNEPINGSAPQPHPRRVADGRLDRLYKKAIRCPYCHTRIERFAAGCPNCGITKEQIYHAHAVENKRRKGEPRVKKPKPQIIMSKVRPASIPFWKMAIGGMFGLFGVHCFVAKRWKRGIFILGCFLLYFILSICIFYNADPSIGQAAHWLRAEFESKTYMFPTDLLGIVAAGLWVWDWFNILFGKFKYPVVIEPTAEATTAATAETTTKGDEQ